MTDKVHASFGRTYRSRERSAAVAYGGATGDGLVWPSTGRLVEDSEGDLANGALNAFNEAHGANSYDVTIDTGEAVVRGAYLARDTTTTLNLPANDTVTVKLGWRDGQADTILLGDDAGKGVGDGFNAADPRLALWTFTTDGSGVTGATREFHTADEYRILSAAVEATKEFAEGDSFNGYPLTNPDVSALEAFSAGDAFNGYPLGNSDLVNSTVTVAGKSVGLGGSTAVSLSDLSDYPVDAGDLDTINYVDWSNNEQGEFGGVDGRLFWDKSVGLYIRSENAPKSTAGPRAVWSSENVREGNAISFSFDGEDKPTIAVNQSALPLGEVKYYQTSDPNGSKGETWYNPDIDMFYVYDTGQDDWVPIPPAQILDESTAFDGSDASITLNNTEVSNGSIQLHYEVNNTNDLPNGNNSNLYSGGRGIRINPNNDLDGVRVTVTSATGGPDPQDVFLADTNENILAEGTEGYTAGDTAILESQLSAGTRYYVGLYNNGSDYKMGYYDSGGFPYTSTDIDVEISVNGCHPDDGRSISTFDTFLNAFTSISSVAPATGGNAVVEWGSPTQISSWDLATFQKTLDGESVQIDVEDGGGTTLFSDIGRNFDISTVDTSKNARLKAYLSRSNTNNNPTLDYAARRYIR